MTGTVYVDFPAVCKHFGWDPTKVCGPVVMSAGDNPEGNCPYDHPAGCALHHMPKVKGKPFKLADYKAKLQELGLTVVKPELQAMRKAGKKPSGSPRKVGNALIYPTPHFG